MSASHAVGFPLRSRAGVLVWDSASSIGGSSIGFGVCITQSGPGAGSCGGGPWSLCPSLMPLLCSAKLGLRRALGQEGIERRQQIILAGPRRDAHRPPGERLERRRDGRTQGDRHYSAAGIAHPGGGGKPNKGGRRPGREKEREIRFAAAHRRGGLRLERGGGDRLVERRAMDGEAARRELSREVAGSDGSGGMDQRTAL